MQLCWRTEMYLDALKRFKATLGASEMLKWKRRDLDTSMQDALENADEIPGQHMNDSEKVESWIAERSGKLNSTTPTHTLL